MVSVLMIIHCFFNYSTETSNMRLVLTISFRLFGLLLHRHRTLQHKTKHYFLYYNWDTVSISTTVLKYSGDGCKAVCSKCKGSHMTMQPKWQEGIRHAAQTPTNTNALHISCDGHSPNAPAIICIECNNFCSLTSDNITDDFVLQKSRKNMF